MALAALSFLTWNLKYGGRNRTLPKSELLKRLPWDVAALQEVSPSSWAVLEEAGLTEGAVCTLESDEPPEGQRRFGSALLARGGVRLHSPSSIAGPKPGRGIGAKAVVDDAVITVCSWHAPNAAGQGTDAKTFGYRRFLDWIVEQDGPLILGFDSNHWARATSLELEPVLDNPKDRWLLEHQFFGADPPHHLRDVFLDHLRERPEEYARVIKMRPDGPLAVSYVRGSSANPTEDRFDYIFVSGELRCLQAAYRSSAGFAAGSDHAPVTAELRIERGGG